MSTEIRKSFLSFWHFLIFLASLSWSDKSFLQSFYLFIYIFTVLDLRCCAGFSLVVESGGYSRCSAWVSHCGDFSGCGAQAVGYGGFRSCNSWALEHTLSVVVAHGLSCSVACGIFPDQGSNSCLLHRQVGSLPLNYQGSPMINHFN